MSTAQLKQVATGQEQQPKSPVAAFSSFMDKFKPQLALALPKHLTADRMSRLALTAFSSSPKLQQCDPKTIAASIMTAGQLGLEVGVNGAGFLVPYGRTCTFVPGWKGLVDLVARSGRGTVFTGVIFKDQDYTFLDGARRDLIIHNETDLDDPADITHAYAIGWVKDASMPVIELWRVSKIRKHLDKYNKVGNKHYAFRDWEMYCRKVPLLQVLKYMPCSVEVSNAMAISNAAESGRGATIENGIVIDMDGPNDESDVNPETVEINSGAGDLVMTLEQQWAKYDEVLADYGQKEAENFMPKKPRPAAPAATPAAQTLTFSFAQVESALLAATTREAIEEAGDLIRHVKDDKQKSELSELYGKRQAEIE